MFIEKGEKMKKGVLMVLVFSMLCSLTFAAPAKKFSDLMTDEAFAKATSEQRLELVHKKLEAKEFASGEINGDLATRLFMDRLKEEKDPDARFSAYGQLRGKFNKLPATFELEGFLAQEYLAATPEGQKGDLVGMMKNLLQAANDKKISWPGHASLHEGMFCAYLVSHAEFNKMTAKDKLAFIKKLVDDKVVKDMTTTRFSRGILGKALSEVEADKQKAVFEEAAGVLDFFTKTSIQNGYEK
jgi:hypothetical protein